MNYIFEAFAVGLYTTLLYLLFLQLKINNLYILLLVVGFCKHFLSSIFKIHDYYCNYGEACIKMRSNANKNKYISNVTYIVFDSIIESILFLFFGICVSMALTLTNIYLFFILGVILHIISEKTNLHQWFCEKRCDQI